MKGTDHFKQTIKAYLDERAATDTLFAEAYGKEGKTIDKCVTYILNRVQKSGCNGFADAEIYSMAVHYYDEDGIDEGKAVDAAVVVNHAVELTDEEKAEAHAKALEEYQAQEREKIAEAERKKAERRKERVKAEAQQPSLFGEEL